MLYFLASIGRGPKRILRRRETFLTVGESAWNWPLREKSKQWAGSWEFLLRSLLSMDAKQHFSECARGMRALGTLSVGVLLHCALLYSHGHPAKSAKKH